MRLERIEQKRGVPIALGAIGKERVITDAAGGVDESAVRCRAYVEFIEHTIAFVAGWAIAA